MSRIPKLSGTQKPTGVGGNYFDFKSAKEEASGKSFEENNKQRPLSGKHFIDHNNP